MFSIGLVQRRFISTISGNVPILLQYHVTNVGPSGANSDYRGIDDLKILRGGRVSGLSIYYNTQTEPAWLSIQLIREDYWPFDKIPGSGNRNL